jgi:hypothetical protein
VGREIGLEDVYLLDREPSLEEEVIVRDPLEKMLQTCTADERAVIERSLQGQSVTTMNVP